MNTPLEIKENDWVITTSLCVALVDEIGDPDDDKLSGKVSLRVADGHLYWIFASEILAVLGPLVNSKGHHVYPHDRPTLHYAIQGLLQSQGDVWLGIRAGLESRLNCYDNP
jgi:hypothetical protein